MSQLPTVVLCLFGGSCDFLIPGWQRAWASSGNENQVVILSSRLNPNRARLSYPTLYAQVETLPGAEVEKNRGQSDVIKAQAFAVLGKPCIVLDVDTRVFTRLGVLRAPMGMVIEPSTKHIPRKWPQPISQEYNAGVIYQNTDCWPLFKEEWQAGIDMGCKGGLCYGQFVFSRVMDKVGGVELDERYNVQWEKLGGKDKPRYDVGTSIPIPTEGAVLHFNGPARKFYNNVRWI